MQTQSDLARESTQRRKGVPFTDFVVDGLLHGMCAGSVMLALFLVLGRLMRVDAPELLAMLDPSNTSAMQGALRHVAMSAIYGIVWSTLIVLPVRRRSRPVAIDWRIAGLTFGVGIWLVALVAIRYWTGLSLFPWYILLIAHLAYGGTLGYLQMR